MYIKFLGNSTLLKFLQNEKAKSPIYFNSSGNITFSKVPSEKAPFSIRFTFVGIIIFFRELQTSFIYL